MKQTKINRTLISLDEKYPSVILALVSCRAIMITVITKILFRSKNMNIGINIYTLRKEKKITQAQLAEKIGVSVLQYNAMDD